MLAAHFVASALSQKLNIYSPSANTTTQTGRPRASASRRLGRYISAAAQQYSRASAKQKLSAPILHFHAGDVGRQPPPRTPITPIRTARYATRYYRMIENEGGAARRSRATIFADGKPTRREDGAATLFLTK